MIHTAKFVQKSVRVIDLSADYRIKNTSVYKKVYGRDHKYPELLKEAAYGLPELNREKIKKARVVANTGCYAVCAVLAAAPALKAFDVESVICDAKTGISGAGIKPTPASAYINVNENVIPYNAGRKHRHVPEIEEALFFETGKKIKIILTPQITSMDRGMVGVCYIKLKKTADLKRVRSVYEKAYGGEKFIRLVESINLRSVQNTNFCDINIEPVKELNMLIVISALDNLGKGASWQAVQNMNIMFGFDEAEGLL